MLLVNVLMVDRKCLSLVDQPHRLLCTRMIITTAPQ